MQTWVTLANFVLFILYNARLSKSISFRFLEGSYCRLCYLKSGLFTTIGTKHVDIFLRSDGREIGSKLSVNKPVSQILMQQPTSLNKALHSVLN